MEAHEAGLVTPEFIQEGLNLLMDVPWATTSVEQQHASCSMVARHHPDFERQTLVLNAGIHTFNRLLPSLSKAERS